MPAIPPASVDENSPLTSQSSYGIISVQLHDIATVHSKEVHMSHWEHLAMHEARFHDLREAAQRRTSGQSERRALPRRPLISWVAELHNEWRSSVARMLRRSADLLENYTDGCVEGRFECR